MATFLCITTQPLGRSTSVAAASLPDIYIPPRCRAAKPISGSGQRPTPGASRRKISECGQRPTSSLPGVAKGRHLVSRISSAFRMWPKADILPSWCGQGPTPGFFHLLPLPLTMGERGGSLQVWPKADTWHPGPKPPRWRLIKRRGQRPTP